jgi:hypothetical protein
VKHVVAVEADVDRALHRLRLAQRRQHVAQPVREVGAARANADEIERALVLRDPLGDLVSHPAQRARDAGRVQQLAALLEIAVGRRLARHQR